MYIHTIFIIWLKNIDLESISVPSASMVPEFKCNLPDFKCSRNRTKSTELRGEHVNQQLRNFFSMRNNHKMSAIGNNNIRTRIGDRK